MYGKERFVQDSFKIKEIKSFCCYFFRRCPPPILQHSGSPPAQIRHANSDIFPFFATESQAFFVLFKILRKLTTYQYAVWCKVPIMHNKEIPEPWFCFVKQNKNILLSILLSLPVLNNKTFFLKFKNFKYFVCPQCTPHT